MVKKCNLWILLVIVAFYAQACKQKKPDQPPIFADRHDVEAHRISNMDLFPETDTATIKAALNKGNELSPYAPDSALAEFKKAFQLSKKSNFDLGIAVSLLNIGDYWYNNKKDYDKARICYFHAMPYCRLAYNQQRKILPGVYLALGNSYFMESQIDSAMYWYKQSLLFLEKSVPRDTLQLISAYIGIGAAIETLDNNNNRSFAYTYKAGTLAQQYQKDTAKLVYIWSNLGSLYRNKKNYDTALRMYNQVLQFYKKWNSKDKVQEMYAGIAAVYLIKNDLLFAKKYLDSAIKVDSGAAENNPFLLQNIGCFYYFSGEFRKAVSYYEKSTNLGKADKERRKMLNNYETLAALYDTIGEGHNAYIYHKKYTQLKDSFLNEEKIRSVNQTEVKYRTADKDKELIQKRYLIAQQQNKIQQQYLGIGAAIIIILLLITLFYRRRNKATINQLKAMLAGEEKERLRMAAELHDGIVSKLSYAKMNFDALTPIHASDTVDAEEFRDALTFLEQSIVELRTTSQNMLPSILKKAGLAAALSIYCQKINKVLPLKINFELIGTLPPLKEDFQLNIYRIIQELINNIVKHAAATEVEILFTVQGKILNIKVADNGIGMSRIQQYDVNGVGLYNLQNRLKILNGESHMESQNGTTIFLKFNLKHHIVLSK